MRRVIISLAGLLASVASSAHAYTFGQQPYNDVRAAAAYYANQCDGLTIDKLTAYILAPTWTEVTWTGAVDTSTTLTPSPIALSRDGVSDDKPSEYLPGQNIFGSTYHRAFWHPGIGAWQLDDIGNGTALSTEKFNSRYSAMAAAQTIAYIYCHSDKSAYHIFYYWAGCASDGHFNTGDRDRCDQISKGILALLSAKQSPQMDPGTDRYGGGEPRLCGLLAQNIYTFPCIYVPTTAPPAEGYTGSWIYPPLDGNPGNSSPLALPFYVYKQSPQPGDTNSHEWRYWMQENTGFTRDIAAQRLYGQNSRTALNWFPSAVVPSVRASVYGLCDYTTATGACGTDTVWVIATLDGVPWFGVFPQLLSFRVIGPTELDGLDTPARYPGSSPGSYTIQYLSGGPTGSPPTISPSPTQTLVAGQNIVFTLNFVSACTMAARTAGASCPPPPCFTLSLLRNTSAGGSIPTASPSQSAGCGTGQYVAGEVIQFTATPANRWNVLDWTGTQNDASSSTVNSLVMPAANQTVTVDYVQMPVTGTAFFTLPPCRLIDSRDPTDPNGPALTASENRLLLLVGSCGLPSEATALSANVTVVNPSTGGFLAVSPDIGVTSGTSTINFRRGQVRANNGVMTLNGYGGLVLSAGFGSGSTDFLLDVNGYFALPAPSPVTLALMSSPLTACSSFALGWSQNSDATFAAYRIYRAVHPGVTVADTLIAEVTNQQQLSYTDAGLQPGRYYYNVVTVNLKGGITYSDEVYGRVFAPSEVRYTIAGIPEPGDTTFPPNVAIPDAVAVLYSTCGPAIHDEEGDVLKRRHFSVPIAGNLLNGVNNLQIIVHEFDILDFTFSASDDSYSVAIPGQAITFGVPKGGSTSGEFSPGTGPSDNITLVNGAGVHNNSAGTLVLVPFE